MPRTKKDESLEIVSAAAELFAQKGYTNVTLDDIASASGKSKSAVRSQFATKEEVILEAFRRGQRGMEIVLRQPVSGDLNAHLGALFDGLMEAIQPWGPERYLGLLYQATTDSVLRDMVKRSSEKMNFAVKAFLAQMVAMSIVEQIQEVERVNRELVSSFVEHLADTLKGEQITDIRKAWVKNAGHLVIPSHMTSIPR